MKQEPVSSEQVQNGGQLILSNHSVIWGLNWASRFKGPPVAQWSSSFLTSILLMTHYSGYLRLLQNPSHLLFFCANSCQVWPRRSWKTARKMSRLEKMETRVLTSGLGWTLRSIKHLPVNTRPLAFLTQARSWVSGPQYTHTHAHTCTHTQRQSITIKVMKV